MVYWDKVSSSLQIDLGRSDLCDVRKGSGGAVTNNSRLLVGTLRYYPKDPAAFRNEGEMRLNLWDAEIAGRIGADSFRILSLTEPEVTVIETSGPGKFEFEPFPAINPRFYQAMRLNRPYEKQYLFNPPPLREKNHVLQNLLNGKSFKTVWKQSGNRFFISTDWDDKAEKHVAAAAKADFNELEKKHRELWHAYYRKSFLTIPDKTLEQFYWVQIYKFFAAPRSGGCMLDLMGPWTKLTYWPAVWWNLNLQLTYLPVFSSNRLELAEPMVRTILSNIDTFRKNAGKFQNDSAAVGGQSGYDCVSPVKQEKGNLVWACQNIYDYYRYSGDVQVRDRLYQLLKPAVNLYFHLAEEGPDGKLHLPETASPEYGNTRDCAYDLAIFRWGCQTLLELSKEMGNNDPDAAKWQDALNRLVPYHIDATGYKIGADLSLTSSHRHYSHLFMVYPLRLEYDLAIAQKSIRHWLAMPEGHAGYTYTGAAGMAAVVGDGETAAQQLHNLLKWMENRGQRNTMYQEGSNPVMETPLSFAASLQDMLIQSHNGIIRVFPAVPKSWKDAEFRDLRTEGAFLVSARLKDGSVSALNIRSERGGKCRIQWDGKPPRELAMKPGESIMLVPGK